MRPPRRNTTEFERIQKYDEWITGVIQEIKLEENRKTGFKNDDGSEKYSDMVRFKFALEGHKFPHYSRWMSYTLGDKANLYLKYVKYLVEGAQPDMVFDLDALQGMKIKTMWSQNGEFDNLEQIRPIAAKLKPSNPPESADPDPEEEPEVLDED